MAVFQPMVMIGKVIVANVFFTFDISVILTTTDFPLRYINMLFHFLCLFANCFHLTFIKTQNFVP